MAFTRQSPSWSAIKSIVGDSASNDVTAATDGLKQSTGIDIEGDFLNNIGSPFTLALSNIDLASGQYNGALWFPLKDSGSFKSGLEQVIGLASEQSMTFSKEGDFYMLPAAMTMALGKPTKAGFGIKDSHFVIALGDKTFEALSKGGLQSS